MEKKSEQTPDNNAWKKWSMGIIIICILTCLIGPVIINELYKLEKGYETFFTPSDVLSFLGSALSAISAILLGIITVYQTNRANEMSQRLMDLEFNRYKMEHRPFVIVDRCSVEINNNVALKYLYEKDTDCISVLIGDIEDTSFDWACIEISLRNSSDFCEVVSLEELKRIKESPKCFISVDRTEKKFIGSGEQIRICIYATQSYFRTHSNLACSFSILLENRFGTCYREKFELWLLGPNTTFKKNDYNRQYAYTARNYRIEKYISYAETISEEL